MELQVFKAHSKEPGLLGKSPLRPRVTRSRSPGTHRHPRRCSTAHLFAPQRQRVFGSRVPQRDRAARPPPPPRPYQQRQRCRGHRGQGDDQEGTLRGEGQWSGNTWSTPRSPRPHSRPLTENGSMAAVTAGRRTNAPVLRPSAAGLRLALPRAIWRFPLGCDGAPLRDELSPPCSSPVPSRT